MTDTNHLPEAAVEAARKEIERAFRNTDNLSWRHEAARAALTAALPHLSPPGEEIGRLIEVAEDRRYSDEAVGITVRNSWPVLRAALSLPHAPQAGEKMPKEVKLQPGWLSRDVNSAAAKVREWSANQPQAGEIERLVAELQAVMSALRAALTRPNVTLDAELPIRPFEIEMRDRIWNEALEAAAKIAAECKAETLRQSYGGLSSDWIEGFQAACEFVAVAIRRSITRQTDDGSER